MHPDRTLLQAITARFLEDNRLPGAAVGIVADGALTWSYGHGFADRASGRRPDEQTLYRIASITKTFTATAIMALRDAGRLRLDDPLVAHLPEANAITNPFGPVSDVTIRRLLTHTSGLQGDHPMADPRAEPLGSIADVIRDLGRVAVVIAPDTQTKYCNIGFQILGAVIERLSGEPYAAHVERTLLRPLGLSRTAFEPPAAERATGYQARHHSDDLPLASVQPSALFEADGGLWSSVSDLARWVAFWLSDAPSAVLQAETRSEMLRPWIVGKADWTEMQGLCWYWQRHGEERYVGHAGGWHGFVSRIALAPADGVGAIALVNGVGDATPLAFDLLDVAVAGVRSRPLPESAPPEPLPAAYGELLGAYCWRELAERVRIEWRDRALVLFEPDETQVNLEPTADPLGFSVRGGSWAGDVARFVRGDDGQIALVNVGGYPFTREG